MEYKIIKTQVISEGQSWLVFTKPNNVFYIDIAEGEYRLHKAKGKIVFPDKVVPEHEYIRNIKSVPDEGDIFEV